MKLTIQREPFERAFQVAAAVAPKRSPAPILANVKLDADGQHPQPVLTATDYEIGVRIHVRGIEIEAPGSCLLPTARMASILRESSDETLRLETEESGVLVRGARSEYHLGSASPEEFPAAGEWTAAKWYEIAAPLLRGLIRRAIFAADVNDSRYALGGALVELSADDSRHGEMRLVATDSRRLATAVGPVIAYNCPPATETGAVIVPARSLAMIERALAHDDEPVSVAIQGHELAVHGGWGNITARLLEGRFPRWRDVLPKRPKAAKVDLPVGPVHAAVRQAAIVSDKESRGMLLRIAEGNLQLSGETAEIGASRVEFPIGYGGPPITLLLNHQYLAEMLRVLDPESFVTMEVADPDTAAIFTTTDGFSYVLMPMARESD